jgi:adenosylhomocysteine nucleosidase
MKRSFYLILLLVLISCHSVLAQTKPAVTAILGAFPPEIKLIYDKMQNRKDTTIQHILFIEGTLNGRHVVLAKTGIGKVNAAITSTLVIEHFSPSEVIFTGIAGGVNPALSPGDLVIGSKVAYHDYGTITADSLIRQPTKKHDNTGSNPIYFQSSATLVKLAETVSKQVTLQRIGSATNHVPQIVTGVIVTGDVFVSSAKATQEFRTKMNAEATEMEGAAVAQTCYQQQVPFLLIRSLSDSANGSAHNDVAAFYKVAAYNSATLVMAIVAKINRD